MVFDQWTLDDMPDMYGKMAIVTGANSGIGFETAKALAEHNCVVILACRSEKKGLKAVKKINNLEVVKGCQGKAIYMHLDLASFASVRSFVEEFDKVEKENNGLLRILVNNAGVSINGNEKTEDGIEFMHQVNYYAPFLLTHLLTPKLVANSPCRVITCTSDISMVGSVDWDDLTGLSGSLGDKALYARTKLMDHMFGVELNHRLSDSGVESFVVHPGFTKSGMSSKLKKSFGNFLEWIWQPTSAGALSTIYCASSNAVSGKGGLFFGPSLLVVNNCAEASPRHRLAVDANACLRLWNETEQILDIHSNIRMSIRR